MQPNPQHLLGPLSQLKLSTHKVRVSEFQDSTTKLTNRNAGPSRMQHNSCIVSHSLTNAEGNGGLPHLAQEKQTKVNKYDIDATPRQNDFINAADRMRRHYRLSQDVACYDA